MTYQPDFSITLKSGETIHMLLLNKAFRIYSERNNLKTRSEVFFSITDFNVYEIWLAGHECYCIYNNIPFSVNELEAAEWVNNVVGLNYDDFTSVMTMKLYGLDSNGYQELVKKGAEIIEENKKKVVTS